MSISYKQPAVEVKLFAQIGNDEPIEIGVLTVEKLSDLTDFTAALNTLNTTEGTQP